VRPLPWPGVGAGTVGRRSIPEEGYVKVPCEGCGPGAHQVDWPG